MISPLSEKVIKTDGTARGNISDRLSFRKVQLSRPSDLSAKRNSAPSRVIFSTSKQRWRNGHRDNLISSRSVEIDVVENFREDWEQKRVQELSVVVRKKSGERSFETFLPRVVGNLLSSASR